MQLTKYENVEIYKDDVIEALAFEPNLYFGSWCSMPTTPGIKDNEVHTSCEVCAVGSILRPHFTDREFLNDTAIYLVPGAAHPECIFDEGMPQSWMAALSFFWESLGQNETPVEEARRLTIDFVEEYFPDDEVLAAFTVEKQITTNAFGKPV